MQEATTLSATGGDQPRSRARRARRRAVLTCAALALGACPAADAGAQAATTLDITISNIRNARGHIRAAVCTPATFLHENCPYHGAAPARVGSVTVHIGEIPPGTYAVQVFQDEDDSDQIKLSWLGLPVEGVGFSRDASILLGAPSFSAAAFQLLPTGGHIALRLRYFD